MYQEEEQVNKYDLLKNAIYWDATRLVRDIPSKFIVMLVPSATQVIFPPSFLVTSTIDKVEKNEYFLATNLGSV